MLKNIKYYTFFLNSLIISLLFVVVQAVLLHNSADFGAFFALFQWQIYDIYSFFCLFFHFFVCLFEKYVYFCIKTVHAQNI